MNRLGILLPCILPVVAVLGCGRSDADGESPSAPAASPASTTASDTEVQLYTTESGLECPQDLFEMGTYEAGMAGPGAGFADTRAAAADYWTSGDGRYRNDRDQLAEVVDGPVVRYDNERGETQLILSFVQIDGLWLLDSSEACSYAPAVPAGQELPDVRDQAGAVLPALLLGPDELPSYESRRGELGERRFVVMQPGDLGYDAVILCRSTPQCGNLPDIVVDGDRSALQVTIQTPVSGDCDAIDYDRAIGLDLAAGFEQTPITVS